MKSSLDQFYDRYRGYVNVTAGYCEDRRIPFILKACRLRPYRSCQTVLPRAPTMERLWIDEHHNSFLFCKNKRIRLYFNDVTISQKDITCTDIYSCVSIQDLYTISKLLYIRRGLDETTGNPVFILSFLGRDNYLRTKTFCNGVWESISPLYLELWGLRKIADNITIRHHHELLTDDVSTKYPIADARQWITYLPAHRTLISSLESEYPGMTKTIGL